MGSRGSGEAGRGVGARTCTTGRTGVALAGTAVPSQRKPRCVPGYETESRLRQKREKKAKEPIKEAGTSLTSAGKESTT